MIRIIFFVFILFLSSCVQREPLVISANIQAEQEVPPTNSLAFGALYAVVGRDQDFMSVRVSVSCIEKVTGAHFHLAPDGQNGGVIVTLFSSDPVSDPQKRFSIDLTVTADDFDGEAAEWSFEKFLDEVLAGNVYLNVHNVEFPAGACRGQLERFR